MTYNQLKNLLSSLTEEQLNMDVTIHALDADEFYPIPAFIISDDSNDVLDNNHPYLEG